MGLTVNKWHYFGLATWATTRLGLSEWLLRRVRDDVEIARYHYPTQYRVNTVGSLSRVLSGAGFTSVEFRMWDLPRLYTPYLPSDGRGRDDLASGRIRARTTDLMGNLTFRAIR